MSLQINHISYAYSRGFDVVSDLTLEFPEGGIYGLLGKNGTGKSTLLYLIMGLLRPKSGNVSFLGHDTTERNPEAMREMFIVPEEYDLPNILLSEYISVVRPFYPNFSDDILQKCLEGFGMTTDVHLGRLSMGQKKKVYMCIALASGTRLLVMDEPTNGLDIPSKSQFRRVVASGMTDDKIIIISTHQVRDVELLLDHVTVIDTNRVLLNERMADISSHLRFTTTPTPTPPADTLYAEPTMGGYSIIQPRSADDADETPVNLELLFNGLIANAPAIQQRFRP